MKNVEDIYPLSPLQQGILFHTLYASESGMYLEQKIWTLNGKLDIVALQKAWDRLVDRHCVLRTAFIWKDLDEPLQFVREQVKLSWEQQDWRGSSSQLQQEQLEAFLRADRTSGMNMSKAPLMRFAVFRLDEEAYQFVWTHHHILLDGWSLPLIFRELFGFYEAFRQGKDLHLGQSRPYRDYISWLQQQDLKKARTFWREELRDFAGSALLRPERDEGGSRPEEVYGEARILLSEQKSAPIKSFAQQHELTINTLVQGAWGLLLSRYCGERDVIFGATGSGRPPDLAGVESIIGLFINTLPVRVRIEADRPLVSWLKELQAKQLEAREYEYTPLARIQGWSDIPKDQPLFETILVFENYPVDMDDVTSTEQDRSLEIADFWAREKGNYSLVIKAGAGREISLGTLHDRRRFDDRTIAGMLGHLETVLNSMAQDPGARLGDLEKILKEIEKREQQMERRKRKEINLSNFMGVSPKTVALSNSDLIKTGYLQSGQDLPLVISPAMEDVDVHDWAKHNVNFVEKELAKHGAVLFREFAVDSVPAFERFAQTLRPDLYDQYGDLPRESGKVYKSTPYPENKTILFHNESSHMHRWPMKQWFFCVKASPEGGETPIVDCRKIYQSLDPKIIDNVRKKGLMYVRHFVQGLDVSWQAFFRTEDKSSVEEYCRRNLIEFEWTENDGLLTKQFGPGVAKHPLTSEMVFFNQVQLHHVCFLDPDLRRSVESMFKPGEYPRNVYYGDGSPIEDSVMEEIARVYWKNSVAFSWHEGDILMVDNMLVAHARNPFKGERKIVVALAEMFTVDELAA